MCNSYNNCSCFTDTLCTIVKLQKQGQCIDSTLTTCDRPYLGIAPTSAFNTRPISLYTCPGNNIWTMPYTLNGEDATSTVFRIEAVEDCCATFRVLAPNPDTTSNLPYVSTESFFTINLNCLGSLRCLPDTLIPCI